jgi:S-DNA-T family DNA segregation ATPase FtsK/SpoIIIE
VSAVVNALKRWRADVGLIYIGNRRSSLASNIAWDHRALDVAEASEVAAKTPGWIGEMTGDMSPWVVVIEGLPEFVNSPADMALGEMARAVVASGHLLVTEGEPAALSGGYPLLVTARSSRRGIVLQPEQSDSVLFRAQFPRLRRGDFPPGRGLYVPRGGQPFVVQVALP